MPVRITNHSGRVGKKGVYSVKHNDRNFDVEHAKHIDPNKSCENFYWKFNIEKIPVDERNPDATFDEHESLIYYALFSTQLAKSNDKYIKQRHKEKVQSMEHFRTQNKQYCPEETLMYLGNSEECVSPEILKQVFEEYRTWHEKTFPLCIWLDAALHLDERTPHIHERHVWTASYTEYAEHYNETHERKKKLPDFTNGEEDYLMIGQVESLRQMEIEPPKPNKPTGQYNNAKQTYTRMCREKIAEISQRFGVEIILEPKDDSENGLDLLTYKAKTAKKDLESLQAEADSLTQEIQQRKFESEQLADANQSATAQLHQTENQIATNQTEIESLKKKIDGLQQQILTITLPDPPTRPPKPVRPRPTESKDRYIKIRINDSLKFIEKIKEEKRLSSEYDSLVDEWNQFDADMKKYNLAYADWSKDTQTISALQAHLKKVITYEQELERGQRLFNHAENLQQAKQIRELQSQKEELQSQLDSLRSNFQNLLEREYQRRRKHDIDSLTERLAYYEKYCGISPDEIENAVREQEKQKQASLSHQDYDSD